ncbi:MAG: TetR family transcriptional regulator [Actinomycetia bacterium]|nr:TetR family transcriptional regulator [Actinomycetes bacterium]
MAQRQTKTAGRAGGAPRRARGSLSREHIVDAAFEIAEEAGLDELSMPRLAQKLEVGVTSLYWYFRSKEELLDALTEEAVRAVDVAMPDLTKLKWDDHVSQYWNAYRDILRSRPILADLTVLRALSIAHSPRASQMHAARMDRELTVLVEAGFSPEEAMRAYATFSGFTRGSIQAERAFAAAVRPDAEPADLQALHLDWAILPTLRAVAPYWTPALATDADFLFGLRAIVAGLRATVAERKRK